jgi:hypothetical protein
MDGCGRWVWYGMVQFHDSYFTPALLSFPLSCMSIPCARQVFWMLSSLRNPPPTEANLPQASSSSWTTITAIHNIDPTDDRAFRSPE